MSGLTRTKHCDPSPLRQSLDIYSQHGSAAAYVMCLNVSGPEMHVTSKDPHGLFSRMDHLRAVCLPQNPELLADAVLWVADDVDGFATRYFSRRLTTRWMKQTFNTRDSARQCTSAFSLLKCLAHSGAD